MRVRLKHERLAEALARSRMTQNRWAIRIGISRGHLSDLVNGRHPYPRAETRRRLMTALDARFEQLFEIEASPIQVRDRQPSGRLDPGRRVRGPDSSRAAPKGKGGWGVRELLQDLRFALRGIGKRPAQTAALVVTLAVGVGVNSSIFSVFHAVMLRSLPYPQSERIVTLWQTNLESGNRSWVAYPNLLDWRERSRSLEALAGLSGGGPETVLGGDVPVRAIVQEVTRDFFCVFSVQPQVGRVFSAEEQREGGPPAAVIGHGFWQSRMGGRPVLGETLRIRGAPLEIIGVMPQGFEYPRGAEIWVSREVRPPDRSRTAHNFRAVGRLASGVDVESARMEMDRIAAQMREQHPRALGNKGAAVIPLHDYLVGDRRTTLWLLLTVVALVLLIACANIANILLSQAVVRRHEIAIRRALGAGWQTITRQLLVESGLMGILGGALGLLATWFSIGWLNSILPPSYLHSGPVSIDWTLVLFTLSLGTLCGLLFGAAPVLQGLRSESLDQLRSSERGSSGPGRRLGGFLVVPQYAFSLMALVVAGLILKSILALTGVDSGIRSQGILTVSFSLPSSPPSSYSNRRTMEGFYDRLQQRMDGVQGVKGTSLAYKLPLEGWEPNGFIEAAALPQARPYPAFRVVGAGYFRLLDIPVHRGREFSKRDDYDSQRVCLVNRSLARRLWGEEKAVGERLRSPGLSGDPGNRQAWWEVVGVVEDNRQASLEEIPGPAVYVPWRQHYQRAPWMSLLIRVDDRPEDYAGTLRRIVRDIDSNLAPGAVEPLQRIVERSTAQPRFRALLLAGFAGIALLLALLGVYGVMSYSVAQRRREMAVRIALGARSRDILRLVVGDGVRFVIVGQLLGLAGAWAATRLISGMLFQVEPTDPEVLMAASALMAGAVLLTCLIPARRAGRTDSHVMLKFE